MDRTTHNAVLAALTPLAGTTPALHTGDELAAALGKSRSRINQCLWMLIAEGLVTYGAPRPTSRRAAKTYRLAMLSPAGDDLLAAALRPRRL